jgi:hypothetical protein
MTPTHADILAELLQSVHDDIDDVLANPSELEENPRRLSVLNFQREIFEEALAELGRCVRARAH